MTKFAPPLVIQCPKCDAHLLRSQLASFSSWRTRYWTDGYTSRGFDNIFLPLARCPSCHKQFWYKDAKELGRIPWEPKPMSRFSIFYAKLTGDKEQRLAEQGRWNNFPIEFKNAPDCIAPEFLDWLAELKDNASLVPEREAIARRQVWWASNDHLRLRSDGTPCRDDPVLSQLAAQTNLLSLLQLHENGAINGWIEKAEISRQLGKFKESIAILESGISEHAASEFVTKIMQLARENDTLVRNV